MFHPPAVVHMWVRRLWATPNRSHAASVGEKTVLIAQTLKSIADINCTSIARLLDATPAGQPKCLTRTGKTRLIYLTAKASIAA